MQFFQGYLVRIPGRAFNAFSEPDGHFQIDGVPLGAYTLSFEALMSLSNGAPGVSIRPASFGLPSQNVTVDPAVNNGVVDVLVDLSVPACVPIPCPGTPACSNNGTCNAGGTCTCAAGFVGPDCAVPVTGPGTACVENNQCSSGICQAGFCQDIRGTCSFYTGPTPTLYADGTVCPGVPGAPSSDSFGRCFDGFCRQTVCVGNQITLLDHQGGTPVNFSLPSCGSDACVQGGIIGGGGRNLAICEPKRAAGEGCNTGDMCVSGTCITIGYSSVCAQ